MPLEQGHLPNVPSISGYRLYHFKGVDAEKYQVLLELVRNHEDILFPHKGKIPLLADNNATYAMCEFKENGYRVCSLGGIDGIAMVLKNYTEARELFSQAHTLLLNGLFRVGDFETLLRDKNNHPNYAVRKASHEAYFTLLQQLLAKKGIGKSS